MQVYKPKKIIFSGSGSALLEILSKHNETEVVSSMRFLQPLVSRFKPNLVVFDAFNIEALRDARKIPTLAATPFLVVAPEFTQKSSLDVLSGMRNIIICNEALVTHKKFLLRLEEILSEKLGILPSKTGLAVKKAIFFINRNFGRKLGRGDIALDVGVTGDYLSRIFSREMGVPLWDYLNAMRLDFARSMIIQGGEQIRKVALECGFSDAAYFDNAFRKVYGLPPSELRK